LLCNPTVLSSTSESNQMLATLKDDQLSEFNEEKQQLSSKIIA
jgi:hypothetical protein